MTSGLKNPKFASQWLAEQGWLTRFTVETFSITGLETMTEVGQALTLDVTQKIYASYNSDIPDVDLNEQWAERWKEAPEIALAMLPVAILGGGGAAFIKPNVVENMVNNEDMMSSIGFDTEVIADIVADQPLSEKIAKFQAAYDPVSVEAAIDAKVEKGDTTLGTVSPEVAKQAREAQDASQDGTREEPAMVANRDEQGNIIGYNVKMPGVDAWEAYQDVSQAKQRIEQWHDENPPGVARKVPVQPGEEPEPAEEEPLPAITEEAASLLDRIDRTGAQPATLTDELKEIAQENDIEVTDATRPDEVIQALREKQAALPEPAKLAVEEQPIKVPKGAEKVEAVDEKGKPVERIKPVVNRQAEQTVTPDTSTVGIKNAKTKEVLDRFGVNLPPKSRIRFADTLEQAQQEEGLVDNALNLADRIIDNPDVSSAKEQASMLIKLHEILGQIDTLETQLVNAIETGDNKTAKILENEITAREADSIKLSRASQLTGTEIGRSLSFRQILLDRQTGNIVRIKRAAKRAGKGKISPKIEKMLEQKAVELDKAISKIESLVKKNAELQENVDQSNAKEAMSVAIKKRSKRGKSTAAKRRRDARKQLTKMGYC